MKRPLFFLLLLGLILSTACAAPNVPTPGNTAIPETLPTPTGIASPAPTEPPVSTLAGITPNPDASPTVLPPTAVPPTATVAPNSAGPSFAYALSGGDEGSLYPEQDISIIAKTGHIQFINVYANW